MYPTWDPDWCADAMMNGGAPPRVVSARDPTSDELRHYRPARVDPPPAVLCHDLTEEQRAQVQRFVDLLRKGPLDREALGRRVREIWIAWAQEQPSPKPSWLVPWEGLGEPDREVDRRIGDELYALGAAYGDAPMCVRNRAPLEPAEREALGMELHRELGALDALCGYVDQPWVDLDTIDKESVIRGAEHIYRLGAASGDSALRVAMRAVVDAWSDPRTVSTQKINAIDAALSRLHTVLAQGPEPLPAPPPSG